MAAAHFHAYIHGMTMRSKLRQTRVGAVGVALSLSGLAHADGTLDHYVATYGPRLEVCIFDADPDTLTDCKGALSQICSQDEEGGYTTIGMVECMAAETRVWDDVLNREYQKTLLWAAEMDALENVAETGFPSLRDAIRDAQRAWISLRDADCLVDYAVWGRGSMRNIAGASCQMEATADRAIHLIRLRTRTQ